LELVSPSGPPLKNLTAAEMQLIESVASDEHVEFDKSVVIRAELIMHLFKESYKGWPVRTHLKLYGATIRGKIDLTNCHSEKGLIFVGCQLEDEVLLVGGTIRYIIIDECIFSGTFFLMSARCHDVYIKNSGFEKDASFTGSTFTDKLVIRETNFSEALHATSLKCQSITLNNITVKGITRLNKTSAPDAIHISDSTFGSDLCSSELVNDSITETAVNLTKADTGSLCIDKSIIYGAVKLDAIHSTGNIDIKSCSVYYSLISLIGAKADGGLSIFSSRATRVFAQHASVDGSVYLSGIITPWINISGMKITGDLTIKPFYSRLREENDNFYHFPLIDASGIKVTGDLCLRGNPSVTPSEFLCTGPIIIRKIILDNAIIERCCNLEDGIFTKYSDTAESDEDAKISQSISAVDAYFQRLIMPKLCPDGIINLSNAKVDIYEDVSTGWPKDILHRSTRKTVDEADGNSYIVLNGFIYRHLANPRGIENADSGVVTPIWKARLQWLGAQPVNDLIEYFKPQPWRQLAAALSSDGYEEDAKRISIERHISYRYSKSPHWQERIVSRLLHLFADYGYNPWKTILWCLGFIFVFGSLYHLASLECLESGCHDATVFVPVVAGDVATSTTENLSKFYPAFGPWHYSLDLFIPIFDLGMESYWHANTAHEFIFNLGGGIEWSILAGQILDWIAVFERILGALMVALAITGFTGLLTRGD
jgi:hypothetical protein